MAKTYTYADFSLDVIAMADGAEFTAERLTAIKAKAEALLATQTRKAEYNATHPKKSTAKGASEATMAKATAISVAITSTPKTATEINAELGTDFTALQVANAVKYIDGVRSTKVIRETTNAKGLKSQKEYTAYCV